MTPRRNHISKASETQGNVATPEPEVLPFLELIADLVLRQLAAERGEVLEMVKTESK